MNKITNCLNKKECCLPVWFMRQAGRYLPEFREIRSKNPDFIKLCLNSSLSSQITLQPLDRFDLDAAIIFSDILLVPYGLGQKVEFIKNQGPILSPINLDIFLDMKENRFIEKVNPVYEAIKITKKKLEKTKSLIGFVGAPWTLLVYMMGIKKDKNTIDNEILNKKKEEINIIMEKLIFFLKIHIKKQVSAGANIIQIFDSWAGLIPSHLINNYCFDPNLKLVEYCKNLQVPVICFPKGLGVKYKDFLKVVKPNAINIDYEINLEWAKENLNNVVVQGGLDPKALLGQEKDLFSLAEKYLKSFAGKPYIFNLGHGLLPETNPDKVTKLINFVREYN